MVTRGEWLRGMEGPVTSHAVVGSRTRMRVKTILWVMFTVIEKT